MTPGGKLRASMKEQTVVAPFICDGIQTVFAEKAGFKSGYMTGFGSAATFGLPDVGLLTLTQMCEKIRINTYCSDLPLIVDADTGYGNYINVIQTVREYERAGAAALHIEDQVWPKRCGYMKNKQVISKEEAVTKIKAAVDARKNQDFIIIARTDTLAVNGWEDVEDRVRSFMEAGADMAFVDGIRTIDDVKAYSERLKGIPVLFNNVPMISMKDVAKIGKFPIVLNPFAMIQAWVNCERALKQLMEDQLPPSSEIDQSFFNHIIGVLGAPEYFELDKRYSNN
ncbi:isocitrate lyase/PEP mutase family protein [Sporomusa sp.]|uniref:isocitrate lyase/PEP mutase family protein n=1 Tax=Sporomusa sp. TaxID=2078658 RepID=UPI002B5E49C1|nr:isocitrate lyase/PEP mutase family protein [Sporomusa sp.]HWR06569.1 isocitrate lyase/PEP mutase family protein [Sporomusa sp.]